MVVNLLQKKKKKKVKVRRLCIRNLGQITMAISCINPFSFAKEWANKVSLFTPRAVQATVQLISPSCKCSHLELLWQFISEWTNIIVIVIYSCKIWKTSTKLIMCCCEVVLHCLLPESIVFGVLHLHNLQVQTHKV